MRNKIQEMENTQLGLTKLNNECRDNIFVVKCREALEISGEGAEMLSNDVLTHEETMRKVALQQLAAIRVAQYFQVVEYKLTPTVAVTMSDPGPCPEPNSTRPCRI